MNIKELPQIAVDKAVVLSANFIEHHPLIGEMIEAWAENAINGLNIKLVGVEHLQTAAIHLGEGKGLLTAAHHESVVDIVAFTRMADLINASLPGRCIFDLPGASKFTEGKMGPAGFLGKTYAKRHGIRWIDIPQYGNRRAGFEAASKVIGILKDTLKAGGGVDFFPGGTRSRSGEMEKATDSIVNKTLYDKELQDNVMLLPVGIIGTRDVHRPGWGPRIDRRAEVQFIIGKPFNYQTAMDEMGKLEQKFGLRITLSDIIMLHIADLMPEEKWGYYRPMVPLFHEVCGNISARRD